MPDARDQSHDRLESALRELAHRLDIGAPPDVAPAVMPRLAGAPTPRRSPLARVILAAFPWRRVLAAGLTVGLLLGLMPGVRTAVADFLDGLPGVLFSRGAAPSVPPQSPVPRGEASLGQPLGLTGPVSLAEARRRAPYPVPVPASLGNPDEVYLRGPGIPHAVTMLWRAHGGIPPLAGSAAGVVVDVIDPSRGPLFEKLLAGVSTERFLLDGQQAVWVPEPHPLVLLDDNGDPVATRLAGRTLLVQHGPVTVRIESLLSKQQAVQLGRSLR